MSDANLVTYKKGRAIIITPVLRELYIALEDCFETEQ
jgi:hypothetical protein